MEMSIRDYKECFEILDLIYSVPEPDRMFTILCERLERLIGISTGLLCRINHESGELQFKDSISFNIPDQLVLMILRHGASIHPLLAKYRKMQWHAAPNAVVSLNDMISDSELSETEYHRDIQQTIPCFYETGFTLVTQGDPTGIVGFHRPKKEGRFTRRERQILKLLAPHVSRSLHIADLLSGKSVASDVGIIEIGKDGRVSYMNEEARCALNGRPVNVIPRAGDSAGPVFFENGPYVYRVRTIPLRWSSAEKTVILEALPDRFDLQAKLKCCGMTKRQEDVAILAIQGLHNKEIAERLFISERTVRDHLRDIFERLAVRSRSQLTAKVLGLQVRK